MPKRWSSPRRGGTAWIHMCSASSGGHPRFVVAAHGGPGAQSAGMRSPLLGQGFGLEPMGVRGPIAGSESALEAQRLADALAKGKQDGWLGLMRRRTSRCTRPPGCGGGYPRCARASARRSSTTQNAQQILPTRLAPRVCMMLSPVEFRDFTVRPLTPEEQPVLADESYGLGVADHRERARRKAAAVVGNEHD